MSNKKKFEFELLNETQKYAFECFQKNDILFLVGAAGCGKTHLATAFALDAILNNKRKHHIVLTRPVVEAGESLGYLPGTFQEKINPYIMPVYDIVKKLIDPNEFQTFCGKYVEIAPLAYLRGRTFDHSICILDEAQNCSYAQLKLFMTRLGHNSKIIITGDPSQTDLYGEIALNSVVDRLRGIDGIKTIEFEDSTIVRHPLVEQVVRRLK